MNDRLSILNIGGHPKDTILYAGGTMAKHVALGDLVCLLEAYNGMRTHLVAIDEFSESDKMPDWDAHVEDRKRELVDAAGDVGVTDVRLPKSSCRLGR